MAKNNKKRSTTFIGRHITFFKSLRIESKILVIIGAILAVVVIGYVALFASFFVGLGLDANSASNRRDAAAKAWYSLQLPNGFEYRNATPYGDIIDSPDDYGWDYNYRHATSDSDEQVYKELQQTLTKAGYVVTASESPNSDPASSEKSYAIDAVDAKNHIDMHITIYGQKYVSATVSGK